MVRSATVDESGLRVDESGLRVDERIREGEERRREYGRERRGGDDRRYYLTQTKTDLEKINTR